MTVKNQVFGKEGMHGQVVMVLDTTTARYIAGYLESLIDRQKAPLDIKTLIDQLLAAPVYDANKSNP